MSGSDFLDTSILVYAYDAGEPRKREVAQVLVRGALTGGTVWSTQVLAEFAVTLLHKKAPAAKPKEVQAALDALSPVRVIVPDSEMVRRAVEARSRYGLHFYDGMIVAAAERGGCVRIWSEDMAGGQKYFGVVVENPFA